MGTSVATTVSWVLGLWGLEQGTLSVLVRLGRVGRHLFLRLFLCGFFVAQGFELGDAYYGVGRYAFAFGSETFHADEVGRLDDERFAEGIAFTEFHLDAGKGFRRENKKAGVGVLAQEALFLGRTLELEAFEVGVPLLGIEERYRPGALRHEFLDAQDVGVVVVPGIE